MGQSIFTRVDGPRATRSALLLALLAAGCGGEGEGPADTVVRRDSLGVSIVESPAPAEVWSVGEEPVLDLGARTGEPYVFQDIQALVRLSDGALAVLDAAPPYLRVFDSTGEFLRGFGSEGDGPGEFRAPQSLAVIPGDTLIVYDWRRRALTRVGPDFAYVETITPEIEGDWPSSLTRVNDSLFVADQSVNGSSFPEGAEGLIRPLKPVELLDSRAVSRGIVAEIEIADIFVGDGGFGVPLFGKWTDVAGFGDRLIFSFERRPEVEWRDMEGELVQIARMGGELREVTQADVANAIDIRIDALPEGSPFSPEDLRRTYEAQPVPETWPAYSRLVVDRSGNAWLGEYVIDFLGGLPRVWDVVGPDGAWLARVELPEGFRPVWIEDDIAFGIARDAFDVETVMAYPLERNR